MRRITGPSSYGAQTPVTVPLQFPACSRPDLRHHPSNGLHATELARDCCGSVLAILGGMCALHHLLAVAALALFPRDPRQDPRPDASPPGDAPEQSDEPEGLVLSTDAAFDGYTLLSPIMSRRTFLLDMQGEVVHTWKSEHTPGNSVYLLEDGRLLHPHRAENNRFRGGGEGGGIEEYDQEGNLLWSYSLSSEDMLAHHDVEPLPNGNVLVIAWEFISHEDAGAAVARGTSRSSWMTCSAVRITDSASGT